MLNMICIWLYSGAVATYDRNVSILGPKTAENTDKEKFLVESGDDEIAESVDILVQSSNTDLNTEDEDKENQVASKKKGKTACQYFTCLAPKHHIYIYQY